jgi:ubiquinone/menaquinone biosynthesis C-methylase UbiE
LSTEGDAGLTYLELLAELGMSRHIGDLEATQELAELCHIDKGKYVLDVGCGIGRTACHLARNGCRVVGVDVSAKMVTRATERARGEGVSGQTEFKVADAQSLPFEDCSFDVAINESVLVFVSDRRKAVSEYVRVTRPGGYVGLNESSWIKTPIPAEVAQFLSSDMFAGARLETVDATERLLAESGLKDIKVNVHRTTGRDDLMSRLRYYGPKGVLRNSYRMLSLYLSSSAGRKAMRRIMAMQSKSPKDVYEYYGYAIFVGRRSAT